MFYIWPCLFVYFFLFFCYYQIYHRDQPRSVCMHISYSFGGLSTIPLDGIINQSPVIRGVILSQRQCPCMLFLPSFNDYFLNSYNLQNAVNKTNRISSITNWIL